MVVARALTLLSALAVLLAAPATANATTISVPYDLAAGPILTGGGVAVATGPLVAVSPDPVRVTVFRNDGITRSTASVQRPRYLEEEQRVDLAGSNVGFAYAASGVFAFEGAPNMPAWSDVFAGAPFGPWPRILSCERRGPAGHEVAVSGKLVAQTGAECEGDGPVGPARIRITDMAARQPPSTALTIEEPAGTASSELRFAGRYLAWRRSVESTDGAASSSYIVYDTTARREAYAVPVPNSSFSCDLSDTGELACMRSDTSGTGATGDASCRGRYRLAWYSIDAPTAHELSVTPCVGLLRVAGRRVAVVRSAANGRAELVLAGLDGNVTPVTSLPARGAFAEASYGSSGSGGLDFDGERVAWASSDCATLTVHVRSLAATRPEPQRARSCPITVARRDLLVDSHYRTRLAVRCPHGCHGTIYMGGVTNLPLIGAYRSFAMPAARRAASIPLTLELSTQTRRLLARGRRLPVNVNVASYGAGGTRKDRTIQLALRRRTGSRAS